MGRRSKFLKEDIDEMFRLYEPPNNFTPKEIGAMPRFQCSAANIMHHLGVTKYKYIKAMKRKKVKMYADFLKERLTTLVKRDERGNILTIEKIPYKRPNKNYY